MQISASGVTLRLIFPALLVACFVAPDARPPLPTEAEDAGIDEPLPNPDMTVGHTSDMYPDAHASDLPVPDMAHDLASPDLASPDLAQPDLASPDLAQPDLASPDLAQPDLASSDLAHPDLASPDLAQPDLTQPDLLTPPDLGNNLPPASLKYDPTNVDGNGTVGAGCPATWKNLGNLSGDAVGSGFTSCGATSGYTGTGNPVDPYRTELDGGNDHFTLSDPSLTALAGSVTVTTWIYPHDQNAINPIFWNKGDQPYNAGNGFYAELEQFSGKPRFCGSGGTCVNGGASAIATNTWNHLAYTISGSTLEVYVNGHLVDTLTTDAVIANTSNKAYLGYNGTHYQNSLKAALGVVTVYNAHLSSDQVLADCWQAASRFGVACAP